MEYFSRENSVPPQRFPRDHGRRRVGIRADGRGHGGCCSVSSSGGGGGSAHVGHRHGRDEEHGRHGAGWRDALLPRGREARGDRLREVRLSVDVRLHLSMHPGWPVCGVRYRSPGRIDLDLRLAGRATANFARATSAAPTSQNLIVSRRVIAPSLTAWTTRANETSRPPPCGRAASRRGRSIRILTT